MRLRPAAVLVALVVLGSGAVRAGELGFADAGGSYTVRVTTWKERQLQRVIRQQYDFSCGSAALATLLTHHYGRPVGEADVFRDMWAQGDQDRIRQQGFSLLDMRNYLERRGLRANAFRAPVEKLMQARVPAIVLITTRGIAHFVVLKGLRPDAAVVADPFVGTRVMDRDEFEAAWNGVVFVILDEAERGRAAFDRAEDWAVRPKAPLEAAGGGTGLAGMLLQVPGRSFF